MPFTAGDVAALEAATIHPALALGIEKTKGTLNFDSDADFVLLSDDLHVLATIIGGECVWANEACDVFSVIPS